MNSTFLAVFMRCTCAAWNAAGARTAPEGDDVLGVLVVDGLGAGPGRPRLAVDVEHLEAARLEVRAQPRVVPVGVGRGDGHAAGAEVAQRLDHGGGGGHGRHAGGLLDRVEHLAVVARPAVEAAGGAAVGNDVD